MDKEKSLKIFFIKLISISIAIIIIINVLFNLIITNVEFINKIVSLIVLERRGLVLSKSNSYENKYYYPA